MPLEKPSYRDNLERIKSVFPDKELLRTCEVAKFCGVDVRTVKNLYGFKDNFISVAKLAREMS